MEGEGKTNPFSLFDRLAKAREEMDTGDRKDLPYVGRDEHQIKKMGERRAKAQAAGSRLRARPKNKHKKARPVLGYMENPGANSDV